MPTLLRAIALILCCAHSLSAGATPPNDGSIKGAYGAMNAFAIAAVFWDRCATVGYRVDPETLLDFGKINGLSIFDLDRPGPKNTSVKVLMNMYFEQVHTQGAEIWCMDKQPFMRGIGVLPLRN